ncbi:LTA synthase family protein [Pseudoflavonifractor capillosus]|uniref:LTA synthase family protein n=1 Tax=Pseudoflavonifractor capillosus TaxID=106588 RepID=UPI00195BDF2F|nr:LTA synthase family protein [Pseudoflavonifractor capillosus]MBM6897474.1 LTA synthase family protein [Pseudoflavonifractor capillosus]
MLHTADTLRQALLRRCGGAKVVLPAAVLLHALVVALVAQVIVHQSAASMLPALASGWFWCTVGLLALVTGLVTFFTRTIVAGAVLTGVAPTIMVFCSYFKALITSVPLTIQDFLLIDQLGDITELNASSIHFSPLSLGCILVLVVWLILVSLLLYPVRLERKPSLWAGAGCTAALVLVYGVLANVIFFAPLGVGIDQKLSQAAVNRETGVLLGLWRGTLNQVYMAFHEGSATPEELQQAAAQALELAEGESDTQVDKQPNIILILSESFFDVTQLPGVAYDGDPLSAFHDLQREGISGTFYTRSLGYGTCNIELEILTGMNTGLLWGEDLYNMEPEVFSRLPSVPSVLSDNGYSTTMVHMYNDSIYHRTPMFEAMGFDKSYFQEDFAAIDPKAGDEGYLEEQRQGSFYSDSYLSQLLIDLYEKGKGDSPQFLYGISMENHAPYDSTKYSPEELTVTFQTNLKGQAREMLQAVCQGSHDASQALGELADYFREQEEPTIIVFFGDHRPGVGLTDGGTVYSKLGMCSADYSRWSSQEMKELYSTDYLIWSNDPEYLPGQPGDTVDRGTNYLGVDLLNMAGAEKPVYWKLLQNLSHTRLNDTWVYGLAQDGTLSYMPPDEGEDGEKLRLLSTLLDDTLYGERITTPILGQISP